MEDNTMADILSGLGGLGGLMKGLTSIMPQDEPATQYLRLQGEVSDLQKQEKDLYVQIGQMAVEQGNEPHVSDDDRVCADGIKIGAILQRRGKLAVLYECIDCDVELYAVEVTVIHRAP